MENEKRRDLIDRNEFYKYLEEIRQDYLEEDTKSSDFAAEVIETVQDKYLADAPAVDAVEVVHGRWEYGKWEKGHWVKGNERCRCSVCHRDFAVDNQNIWIGCPHCLSRMDGDGNDV